MSDERHPVDDELEGRLAILLHEINLVLALMAGRGIAVTLDLVDREGAHRSGGVAYQEIIDAGGVE